MPSPQRLQGAVSPAASSELCVGISWPRGVSAWCWRPSRITAIDDRVTSHDCNLIFSACAVFVVLVAQPFNRHESHSPLLSQPPCRRAAPRSGRTVEAVAVVGQQPLYLHRRLSPRQTWMILSSAAAAAKNRRLSRDLLALRATRAVAASLLLPPHTSTTLLQPPPPPHPSVLPCTA
jgi:hypothetical protein